MAIGKYFAVAGGQAAEEGKSVKKCSHFVSHSWADERFYPTKKVRMMRGFLCLQQLLARPGRLRRVADGARTQDEGGARRVARDRRAQPRYPRTD